jgi:hypothetical protein
VRRDDGVLAPSREALADSGSVTGLAVRSTGNLVVGWMKSRKGATAVGTL